MQDQVDVRSARAVIFWLAALVALLAPASAAPAQTTADLETAAGLSPRLLAEASWHGRPIQRPWPAPAIAVREDAASAASLSRGAGFFQVGGSDRVRRLQRRLIRLGYRPGRIDGLFGPRTQAALVAFQRKHGLPQTGVAGPVTLRILRRRVEGRAPVQSTQAAAPAQSQPSRVGSASQARSAAPVASPSQARTAAPVSTDTGVTGPLSLALSVTALVGLIVLAVLLAAERRRRRSNAELNLALSELLVPPHTSGRVIGYTAGGRRVLRRQAEEIEACCDHRRLELVEVVSDALDGRTAVRDRPGLRRVLRRIEHGDASTVVVPALDQLGTSDEEIRGVLSTLARRRGRVISLVDQSKREAAARRGPEVLDQGGRSWKRRARG